MESGPPNDNESLIIRIRREQRELDGASPVWRGEVTDVTRAQRRFFGRPDELLAYLADRLGVGLLRAAWAQRKRPQAKEPGSLVPEKPDRSVRDE